MNQPQKTRPGLPAREYIRILGMPVWNPDYVTFREWLLESARDHEHMTLLGIVNAHTMNLIREQSAYRECMQLMDRNINDGVGMNMAAKMRGSYFIENLNGSDLIPRLLKDQQTPIRVFLYGAGEASNAGAARVMTGISDHIQIVGRLNGFDATEMEVIEKINQSSPDLLLVALGQPGQELFLNRHRDNLKAGVAVGIGASFDFLSGNVHRAPHWVQSLKMEWCYRLLHEPRRMFRRYVIGNPRFLWHAWRWSRRERSR
jgi:exopolysaccharide biosynthesis WecB/TagA/CpsF family protein